MSAQPGCIEWKLIPRLCEPLGPHLGERDLGTLGVRVEGWPVELATVQLRVVDVEAGRVHAARGDVDDACVVAAAKGSDAADR